MPKVNPDILVWARETAGLSEDEAARKLGLSGGDRLRALETGERLPSRRQLANMAEKYHRPLLSFYLPSVPRKSTRGHDFRTLPEAQPSGSEAVLDTLIRDVQARQKLVRSALEEAEEDEPLEFVGSAQIENGVEALSSFMNETLDFSLSEFRSQKTTDEAFAVLRAATERIGVIVLLMGNLGTHHTNVSATVFRGFALADPVAPFVVINENDSRSAWSFTLLHELAHVFLGETGISGYEGEAGVERFCDAVAARFLLDPEELSTINTGKDIRFEEMVEQIGDFSLERNLSRKMVAYNLLRSDLISRSMYKSISTVFDTERHSLKKDQTTGDGGPNYYVVRRHRVGHGLVNLVKRMVASGYLSTTRAGRVLGVKPTSVKRLIDGNRAA